MAELQLPERAPSQEPKAREIKLNNDTGLLKLFACALMMCDHMGKMVYSHALVLRAQNILAGLSPQWQQALSFLFPTSNLLRAIGRLAMPMFAYCIAVGCEKTRCNWKYTLRLLLMGILVQPLYQEAMGHVAVGSFDWLHSFWRIDLVFTHYYCANLNILFTLTLGTVVIGLYKHRQYALMVLATALVWLMRTHLDYGYRGVVLIVLFYLFLDKPLASFLAVFAYMLNWAMPYLFSTTVSNRFTSTTQLYAILSLILIYLPLKKRRVRLKKWFFYGFYPAHLTIIYLLVALDRQIWAQLAEKLTRLFELM